MIREAVTASWSGLKPATLDPGAIRRHAFPHGDLFQGCLFKRRFETKATV
jgi:hypothetical protein